MKELNKIVKASLPENTKLSKSTTLLPIINDFFLKILFNVCSFVTSSTPTEKSTMTLPFLVNHMQNCNCLVCCVQVFIWFGICIITDQSINKQRHYCANDTVLMMTTVYYRTLLV